MSNFREVPFGRPYIFDEEREAVQRVLMGHILAHGAASKGFQQEFASFMGPEAHALAVSNGMAALHMASIYFEFGPDDEIIVPAMTHTATVHAVGWNGSTPVFVDPDLQTGNLTAERIAEAITPRTKGISLVHFIGNPCHMDEIMALANEHNLAVIEDCAIAIGTKYQGKHVGLWGDVGCFSFYPVKHITTGEGGIFASKHAEMVEKVSKIYAHGLDRKYDERKVPGKYDIVTRGLNYRMSEMQAAMGRVQITRIPEILELRKRNYDLLYNELADLEEILIIHDHSPEATLSYYCMSVVLQGPEADKRDDILLALKERGVGTSIYYPAPVNRMTYYQDLYGFDAEKFPNAVAIADHSIALPCAPHVSEEDILYVAETFKSVVLEFRR